MLRIVHVDTGEGSPYRARTTPQGFIAEIATMDAERFDRLTRTLTAGASRRRLLASVSSGLLATITHHGHQVVAKKRRKKRRKKKKPQPGLPPCIPEPAATTCAGAACGTTRNNNCGQLVACNCPPGRTCLLNGTCAQPCTKASDCTGSCGAGCSNLTTENQQHCLLENLPGVCANAQACSSTLECPRGLQCQECPFMSGEYRCLAVCTT
jgi:hypothetical protein